jgi:hypothetical protein
VKTFQWGTPDYFCEKIHYKERVVPNDRIDRVTLITYSAALDTSGSGVVYTIIADDGIVKRVVWTHAVIEGSVPDLPAQFSQQYLKAILSAWFKDHQEAARKQNQLNRVYLIINEESW